MWDISGKKAQKHSSEFKEHSITAVASGCCISNCSWVPSTEMTPRWARAGDSRIICFGNCVSPFIPQRRLFPSCVSHMQSKQWLTETGKWESDNANNSEWVWLLHKQDNILMFHVQSETLTHATRLKKIILALPFMICLCFRFMCIIGWHMWAWQLHVSQH